MTEGGSPIVPGSFAPGARIAGYLLEEQIGQGGMAVVFRAHDERLDRTVALKILAPALADDEAFRQRFIRESRAAAAVDDPHIIPVFEAGEASGVLFIAMRYVRGGDVRALVRQADQIPAGRIVELVSQVASALDTAHGRGLVHRDVKPANMLLDASSGAGRPDHIYLSDFGLSKASLQTSGLTGTGTFLGTLDYISPEQIEGRPVDGRADQYALACATFELLAGVPPFQRDEAMAVMYAQLSEPPPPLTARRPDLSPAVNAVFTRALAKAASDRYPSCRDFTDALRDALGIRSYDTGAGQVPSGEHTITQFVWASGPGEGPGQAQGTPPAGTPAGAGAAGAGGAAATRVGVSRPTSPDQTAPHSQSDAYGENGVGAGAGGRRGRPFWRSVFALVAIIVVLVAGGVIYASVSGGGGGGSGNKGHLTVLKAPGCSTKAAQARNASAQSKFVPTAAKPFGVVASKDGTVFVVTDSSVQVFKQSSGQGLVHAFDYVVGGNPGVATNAVLTKDEKYLLVAADNGIEVLSTADLESGASHATLGVLQVPGLSTTKDLRAIDIAVTPDGNYAFVSLQFANQIAVFNLARAVSTNVFDATDYVGSIMIGDQPVGLSMAPGGKTLYATNFVNNDASVPGGLSLIDVGKAVTKGEQNASVITTVKTGCGPARVAVSKRTGMVWVTVRQSDAVLGYSAALLSSDPKNALKDKVLVGNEPVGVELAGLGSRVLVVNTDGPPAPPNGHNIAVVNTSAAMSGKAALLGYIPSGSMPHEIAVSPDGKFAYVTVRGSAELQVFRLSNIP